MRVLIRFCSLQKEFSFFFCNAGMTSKTTTLCALRRPWAQMKEPTRVLLRIELEKWKRLLPSLCEVSVPMEREGLCPQLINCYLTKQITALPGIVWASHTLCNCGCCSLLQQRWNPGPVDISDKIWIYFNRIRCPCSWRLAPVAFLLKSTCICTHNCWHRL